MILRNYQNDGLNATYAWWMSHPGNHEIPILVAPTGSGKSVTIAELTRLLFDTWPDQHPRTLVIVPSKELAEQNAEKLRLLLPSHISVGFYSASIGKHPEADVIVATIGSVYKAAHLIGNIKACIIDECHLISPDGKEKGRYRQFLTDLSRYCSFRAVGLTATPFRGNGVWLTDGEDPLFTGIAHTARMQDLMQEGFLAPLVRPMDAVTTRIETEDLKISADDYNLGQLSARVEDYLDQIVAETLVLAADRKKWIAFTPTVENAEHLRDKFRNASITTELVCGSTPKSEREVLIQSFRQGEIRCLVTVLALATGFDVPDVDCIVWARPTRSPVLYVQGAGRGLRISPGKVDCLWLDFSDTTERLGPIDSIKGRKRSRKQDRDAPIRICDECGERCLASIKICPSCGFEFPVTAQARDIRSASNAAVLSSQIQNTVVRYDVTDVRYSIHRKPGSPDCLRVDYWSGVKRVASEFVCFEHQGWAKAKAQAWWKKRNVAHVDWEDGNDFPTKTVWAISFIESVGIDMPDAIMVNESGKWPEIVRIEFEDNAELAA